MHKPFSVETSTILYVKHFLSSIWIICQNDQIIRCGRLGGEGVESGIWRLNGKICLKKNDMVEIWFWFVQQYDFCVQRKKPPTLETKERKEESLMAIQFRVTRERKYLLHIRGNSWKLWIFSLLLPCRLFAFFRHDIYIHLCYSQRLMFEAIYFLLFVTLLY